MSKIVHGLDDYIKQNYSIKYGQIGEIAKIFNISRNTVTDHIKKLGLYQGRGRVYDINHNALKTWSSDMAYVLGFILADGHVNYKRSTLQITLHSKDIEILEFINKFFSSNAPISREKYFTKSGKESLTSRLCITSPIMLEDFRYLGIVQQKEERLQIPNGMSEQYYPDLIRGFFDGDGCVYIDTRSKSPRLDVQTVCLCLDFLSNLRMYSGNLGKILCRKRKNYKDLYNWRICGPNASKFRDLIYQNDDFCLKRKRDRFYSV